MPHNFSFIIDGKLGAMERPGSHDSLEADLEFLRRQGFRVIVSLTPRALDGGLLGRFGFRMHHFPVADFQAPSPGQIDAFTACVDRELAGGRAVVVHCGAGLGRTGTMLACYLVSRGSGAEEAIAEIRRLRPFSVETQVQRRAVADYEAALRRRTERLEEI